MDKNISVIIHTYNEEKNIADCIKSTYPLAQEIIVIDNYSNDKTKSIAKKYGAKVFFHPYSGHVETSRNFGVSKASNEWILLLDADERIHSSLIKKIINLTSGTNKTKQDIILIPRKNIIFDKWIKHTGWWPDHQARLFRKGKITWSGDIDIVIMKSQKQMRLEANEDNAIMHHNYKNIYEFVNRLNNYTNYYAERIIKQKDKVGPFTPVNKGIEEFVNRFIISQGYKDGYKGFLLSILMSFYFFISYVKVLEIRRQLNLECSLGISQKSIILGGIKLFYWNFVGVYILKMLRKVKQFLYNVTNE